MEDLDQLAQEMQQVLYSLQEYVHYQKEEGVEGLPTHLPEPVFS